MPNVDLNDPNIDNIIQQQRQAGNAKPFAQGVSGAKPSETTEDQEAHLRSMIHSTGQLDLDEHGRWDFHGGSSGTVWIGRMREQFGGLLGNDHQGAPFLPRLPRPYPTTLFQSPGSTADSPLDSGLPNIVDLPSKEVARKLCENSLDLACSLLRFVHQPSFYEMFDNIYDTPVENFGNDENQFLPLLYVVLALGCMFRIHDSAPGSPEPSTYKTGIDEGLKYFRAARQMMDITDCRDIISLQAIIFMILFLQSTANLSTCYSYIGIALRSGLRIGLHRNLAGNFNPIEREVRRRLFWIIRKMDTYVSALLGFPQMLSSDDIDQELPAEVDDEYITKDGILPMPEGETSLYSASNAHTRLMVILAKVIKYVYPTKGVEKSVQGNNKPSFVVSHAHIKEIEKDLADWLDKLPMGLRPGGDVPPQIVRVQQLLRLAYAHVQMMLYRPFLHYVSRKSCASKTLDDRSYACAAACVSVSRNIVHITTELKKRGLLLGAYWFTMYTTFFAILSLVFFVLENPDKPGAMEILADANGGKDALNGLAQKSQAADRCSIALRALFEQLPQRLRETRNTHTPIQPKKKRSAPSPTPSSTRTATPQERPRSGHGPPIQPVSRSSTFPINTTSQAPNSQRSSLDGHRFNINTMSNPNLRQNFHDLMSLSMSTVTTPDSYGTPNTMPHYPTPLPRSVNNSLPDLSSVMFPSADPFAYPPNQPMMEFDNVKQEDMVPNNSTQPPNMYISSNPSGAPGIYDNLEGQIFGPLPPYLTQGQQQTFDYQGQMGNAGGMVPGINPQEMNYHTGLTPNGEMNFLLSDADDWSNMLGDPRYRP
ncbi:fungal-specific transcription factor domain-containing protein [Halenospora varia]|nr:fungal-specific transcription factor domain-containing protein [Halenospora varia]